LRQLSESLPDNPRVWYRLGQTYDALAERAFTELQKTDAESAYGYAVAGNLFLKQRRLGSAYAAYRESLSKGVAIPGVHAGLAQIYKETGHSDLAAAEAELERALQPIPPPRPYETFRRLAREAYDHLKLLPSSAEAHLQAARELDEHGQYVQAAAEWREALKLSPGNPDAQMRLAWALYRSRDYDSAMRELAAMPESADVSFLRGASLLNLEQPDKAVPYLERALAAKPTFPSAQAALGQALLRVGKAEQAIPHLKAALPADEDGSTHFQLLRAYQQAGHEQLAQAALAEYQQFRAEFERKLKFEEGP
jgi:predicted Zn-dependent protease